MGVQNFGCDPFDGDGAARIQDQHSLRKPRELVEPMLDQDHRPPRSPVCGYRIAHLGDAPRVEVGCGLVEQHNLGIGAQSRRECHLLAFST
jgi:hypothetical protein